MFTPDGVNYIVAIKTADAKPIGIKNPAGQPSIGGICAPHCGQSTLNGTHSKMRVHTCQQVRVDPRLSFGGWDVVLSTDAGVARKTDYCSPALPVSQITESQAVLVGLSSFLTRLGWEM